MAFPAWSTARYRYFHWPGNNSAGTANANGSNQNMGLDNLFYTNTLAQTAAGCYVIGNCP